MVGIKNQSWLIINDFRVQVFGWGSVLCDSWEGYVWEKIYLCDQKDFEYEIWKYEVSKISKNVQTWSNGWDITKQQCSRFT